MRYRELLRLGSSMCAHLSGSAWFHRKGGHLDLLHPDTALGHSLVVVFVGSLGTVRLSSGLNCGESSWRYKLLLQCIFVWITRRLSGMWGASFDDADCVQPVEFVDVGDLLIPVREMSFRRVMERCG